MTVPYIYWNNLPCPLLRKERGPKGMKAILDHLRFSPSIAEIERKKINLTARK
jgi:hypothetical protein